MAARQRLPTMWWSRAKLKECHNCSRASVSHGRCSCATALGSKRVLSHKELDQSRQSEVRLYCYSQMRCQKSSAECPRDSAKKFEQELKQLSDGLISKGHSQTLWTWLHAAYRERIQERSHSAVVAVITRSPWWQTSTAVPSLSQSAGA